MKLALKFFPNDGLIRSRVGIRIIGHSPRDLSDSIGRFRAIRVRRPRAVPVVLRIRTHGISRATLRISTYTEVLKNDDAAPLLGTNCVNGSNRYAFLRSRPRHTDSAKPLRCVTAQAETTRSITPKTFSPTAELSQKKINPTEHPPRTTTARRDERRTRRTTNDYKRDNKSPSPTPSPRNRTDPSRYPILY